jgi:hypothetical protein
MSIEYAETQQGFLAILQKLPHFTPVSAAEIEATKAGQRKSGDATRADHAASRPQQPQRRPTPRPSGRR